MAYTNFKPEIWSAQIQMQKEAFMVWKTVCNSNFQGDVGRGKTVNIIGLADPAVKKYTPGADIDPAETPADSKLQLKVNQFDYTNFKVDDVDAAQSHVDIMSKLTKRSSIVLAEAEDKYIATVAGGASNKVTVSAAIKTPEAAKAAIDSAFVKLWEANVSLKEKTYLVLTPWMYSLFQDYIKTTLTTNNDVVRSGEMGKYNNATVLMTNTVYNDETYDSIILCTENAITLASGIDEVKAYSPEKQFGEAVKALNTYGAMIVKDKEIVNLQVKNK